MKIRSEMFHALPEGFLQRQFQAVPVRQIIPWFYLADMYSAEPEQRMERYRAREAFCQYSMFLFSHKGVNCHIPCDLSLTGFQNAGHGTFCHVYHAFSAGALPAAGSIRGE